jgi:hypothetical protein
LAGIKQSVSIYNIESRTTSTGTAFVTLPFNGITADVIREIMPPYHLGADLLEGMFAMPPPPPDAPTAWRYTRVTRLIGEIVALPCADARPARLVARS